MINMENEGSRFERYKGIYKDGQVYMADHTDIRNFLGDDYDVKENRRSDKEE